MRDKRKALGGKKKKKAAAFSVIQVQRTASHFSFLLAINFAQCPQAMRGDFCPHEKPIMETNIDQGGAR